jgi:hypothetical protein
MEKQQVMGWALTGRRFGTHQCWAVCIWATHQRRAVRAPWRRVGHLIRLVGFRKASPRPAPPPLASLYSSIPPFLSSLAALLLFAGWVRREAVKRVLFYSSPSSLLLGFYISDEKKDRRQSTQSNVFFLFVLQFVPSFVFGPIRELHKQFSATLVSLVASMVRFLHWVLAAIGGGRRQGFNTCISLYFLCLLLMLSALPKFNYRKQFVYLNICDVRCSG